MKPFHISVIIPIKNRSFFLQDTINSLKPQICSFFDVIVVDDHSTEKEFEIISKICNVDTNIKLIRLDEGEFGAGLARNKGAAMSESKYLFFLDSDDLISEEFLSTRQHYLNIHPNLDLLIFPVQIFHAVPGDSDLMWNEFNDENDLERFLNTDTVWQTSSPIWNRDYFISIGGFDESLSSWQDWDIHVRTLISDAKYFKINMNPDIFWRSHEKSSIGKNSRSINYYKNQKYLTQKIMDLLILNKLNTKKNKYLMAKLIITQFKGFILKKLTSDINFPKIIKKYKLISPLELVIWKLRLFSNNSFLNLILDKLIYLFRQDHFLDTKTTFMNAVNKNAN